MKRLRIDDMTVRRLDLPAPGFRTAHGSFAQRSVALVRLTCNVDGRSVVGWGEAAPLEAWGTESIAEAEGLLRNLEPSVEGLVVDESEGLLSGVYSNGFPDRDAAPASRFALETACLDAVARAADVPLVEWLAGGAVEGASIAVNATLGTGAGVEAAEARVEEGYEAIKVKVGAADLERDLRRVTDICDAVPAEVAVRLDANGAWRIDEATRFLGEVEALGIDYVEQPVAVSEPRALAELSDTCEVDVAADESAHPLARAREYIDECLVPVLVLKPMALGGLVPARQLAIDAAMRRVRVVWTSAVESAVGRSAVGHLAASFPDKHVAGQFTAGPHGLATGSLLDEDVIERADVVTNGMLRLRDGPGLGVEPDIEVLDEEGGS